MGAMVAVATGIGPPLGGLLVSAFGWQAVFAANLPIVAVALLLGLRFMPRDQQPSDSRGFPDMVGILLFLLATVSLVLMGTWMGTHGADGYPAAVLQAVHSRIAGAYFIPPSGRYQVVPETLAGLKIPNLAPKG